MSVNNNPVRLETFSRISRENILEIINLLNKLSFYDNELSYYDKLLIRILERIMGMCNDQNELILESQRALTKAGVQPTRKQHFNPIPKRPNIDKFKRRLGPKTQRYR